MAQYGFPRECLTASTPMTTRTKANKPTPSTSMRGAYTNMLNTMSPTHAAMTPFIHSGHHEGGLPPGSPLMRRMVAQGVDLG